MIQSSNVLFTVVVFLVFLLWAGFHCWVMIESRNDNYLIIPISIFYLPIYLFIYPKIWMIEIKEYSINLSRYRGKLFILFLKKLSSNIKTIICKMLVKNILRKREKILVRSARSLSSYLSLVVKFFLFFAQSFFPSTAVVAVAKRPRRGRQDEKTSSKK